MPSPCLNEASEVCPYGCCPSPFFSSPASQSIISKARSSSAACRHSFAATTASSIFPNIQFTNHESLPSLQESFSEFNKVYPQYSETDQVDHIRDKEYYHLSLSSHTCLDYIGIGLFSYLQYHNSLQNQIASSTLSATPSRPRNSDIPFFNISYKTGNLKTQLLHGAQESKLESAMKKRIMAFLNISDNDYSMVFTANRTAAFKLLAESYPFQTSRKLLTVYDYESEAVEAMIKSTEKRGARTMSAEFSWPRLRIHSAKLRKMIVSKRKKRKKRGLFVFPLHSRVTGARYPYLWMSIAQENGWHVLIDACALGPKDMDSFGLSLFRPDFLICSFYKVFGENPSGFGCLFVKKSTISVLEASTSAGMVNLVQQRQLISLSDESSGTDTEIEQKYISASKEGKLTSLSSFSGRLQTIHPGKVEQGEPSEIRNTGISAESEVLKTSSVGESQSQVDNVQDKNGSDGENGSLGIECRCLDQVESLGLTLITNRARYLTNWLVNSLLKLRHPNTEGMALVRIYGPKIKFDRGPALAFNVFDWKGEKVEPVLVQKLADRSNISLSYGFLHHIWFPDKYAEEKGKSLETKESVSKSVMTNQRKDKSDQGITVVTAALGFLANFEDTYRLWAFVAQFLDADFVEKERWRYTALNQKTIEI
ncbi:Molybdenum cofactor sulfurase [Quillaja saponaria]|uniref:Molybdenum cofactor sulfurase n=1 Tax=Quillaja saponaria TaxID=32244 RepID=A0AAD7VH53_QUISA|nr:Molybdenum cofactor sulfurase [Quillaja saponaria]